MRYRSINLQQKFALFDDQWQPKVIAEMNEYQFKIATLQGEFVAEYGRRGWRTHCTE